MKRKLLATVVAFICFTFPFDVTSSRTDVASRFKQYGIVPAVISKAPKELLQVTYPKDTQIHLGNRVPPLSVALAPVVKWKSKSDRFYLLIFFDPNIPFPNLLPLNFIHWAVGNILGGNVDQGDILAKYFPPLPPPGSAPHRYTFLIYEQPERIVYPPINLFGLRFVASIKEIMLRYKLDDPIAGNFFLSEFQF